MRSLIGDRAFYRRLFTVMLPILTQNLITNFVNLLDNVMVGQVGTEPMSGVAIVNQLLFVFNLCIFGGLAGAGIFTAQFYGKSDNKGVADSFRGKLYIALGVLAVAFFVFIGFGDDTTRIAKHIDPIRSRLDPRIDFDDRRRIDRAIGQQIPNIHRACDDVFFGL